MYPELEQRLRFCGNLPTLPAVAIRIIELANDPEADLNEVAKVIALDPALVTKLFRAANSPLYGLRRKATNLRQILNLLGLQGTLALTLGFSLVATARNATAIPLDMEQFWRRSLLVATACRVIGERLALANLEEPFLAGLLHGIGILALALMLSDQYGVLLRASADRQGSDGSATLDCERLAQIEQERLGADYTEVGAWLLRHWGLPDSLCHAVAGSLRPTNVDVAGQQRKLVECVALATRVADIWMRPGYWQSSPQIAELARQWFGLEASDYLGILEAIGVKFPEIAALFQIRALDAAEVAGILEQAREVLTIRGTHLWPGAGGHPAPAGEEQAASVPEPSISAPTVATAAPDGMPATATPPEQRHLVDPLTGLFGRPYLDGLLRQELANARDHHWPLSVALLDLDHGQQLNHTHSRKVGDQILIALARLLGSSIRRSDTVIRYDDDEFALLLPASGVEAARYLINRLLALIRDWELLLEDGQRLHLTVSAGLATYPDTDLAHCASTEQLLRAADRALYVAKRTGRDRLAVYGE